MPISNVEGTIGEGFGELIVGTVHDARKLLEFRLHEGVKCFIEKICLSCQSESEVLKLLSILKKLCEDADFAFEFCQLGGQAFLKSCHRSSEACQEIANEVIAIIIQSGYLFPSPIDVYEPSLRHPKKFEFKQKISVDEQEEILHVYLRSISKSMHGIGQFGVGYVLWSSSIILSRLFQEEEELDMNTLWLALVINNTI